MGGGGRGGEGPIAFSHDRPTAVSPAQSTPPMKIYIYNGNLPDLLSSMVVKRLPRKTPTGRSSRRRKAQKALDPRRESRCSPSLMYGQPGNIDGQISAREILYAITIRVKARKGGEGGRKMINNRAVEGG